MLSTTLTAVPIAEASHDYNSGMHSSNMYTTNWLQYSPNARCTANAFNNIDNLFTQQVIHQMFQNIHIYDEVLNNGAVTPQTVYDRIDHDNTDHIYNYVLYVGHGGPSGFYGYTTAPNDPYTTPALTSFSTIQSHTQVSPSYRLAFMWVCNGKGNDATGSPTAWNPQYWNTPSTGPTVLAKGAF
ncbi:MAG: hypothetical protein LBI79_02555 [Nitrososphaerota archaeon]|nr:hypothetical protein [Nitrososphaerota archaeon]